MPDEAPVQVVNGCCRTEQGVRRVTGDWLVRCVPPLAPGEALGRLLEVRLYTRGPQLEPEQLTCPFLVEFRYLVNVPPQGTRPAVSYVQLQLTAELPPDWTGWPVVERRLTCCTGAGASLDRQSLEATVQLSVRLCPPTP